MAATTTPDFSISKTGVPAGASSSVGDPLGPPDRPQQLPAQPPTAYRSIPLGNDRLVLTVAEAGELLGISRAFAYELVARGELPVVRFGRRIVVPKARLLELLGTPPSEA
jgi:excisionase family DNA binding protein